MADVLYFLPPLLTITLRIVSLHCRIA